MASVDHDIFCPIYKGDTFFGDISALDCNMCKVINQIREDERERQFNSTRSQTCNRCNR